LINIYTWNKLSWEIVTFKDNEIIFSDKTIINIDEWEIL
jgi:hypothetical protein